MSERNKTQLSITPQTFLDIVGVMFMALDKRGNVTLINRKGCDILEYTQEEIVGKNWFDHFIPKGIVENVKSVFLQLMDGKIEPVEHYEKPILTKNGQEKIIAWHNAVLRDESGNACGMLSSGEDISERLRLEESLQKEREDLKLIIDSSPIIVFYKDQKGKIVRVNKAFAEALKMAEKDFVGKTVFDLYSPEIAQGMTDDDQEVLESGLSKLNIIEQYESASGKRWVQTDKIPICDKNGVPIGLIGFAQDITERKKADDRIVHLNALLRAIRNINQLITHEKNPKRLIQKICDNLVETRGYLSAWIALLDDSGTFLMSAQAGIGKDFRSMVEQLKKGNLPPCGQKALKQSSIMVINKPNVACSDCPLRQIHFNNKRITSEFKCHGKIYGLLNVSVPSELTIDSEEKRLFKEITDDIAFALHDIEVEKERKQTEEKLQKSQSILDMAESVAHIGSWRWDFATNKVTWSKEMFHLFSIDEAEFNGDVEHVVSMRVHPEDLPAVQQANVAALQDHKPTPLEYRILLPDGKERIVWAEGRMVSDESELVVAFVGYVQDITGRKVIEETLRESEEQFRIFIEQAPMFICVFDLDGKILLVNNLGSQYTGYSKEELLTMNVSDIDHEIITKEHRKLYWDKLNINKYMKFESIHRRKNGSTYPIEIQLVKIKFKEPHMILAFVSDITERKTADDQIKKDLKEKEILLREIHHRVKNNLQIIKSLLNLQADQVKSKTLINAFNECVARIQSMAMVHEQLYYSDDLTNIPFRTYIKKMSNELIRSYHLKTVIALNLKIKDIFLSIDKAIPLGLILNELLTNAMKYAFLEMEKGRITISLQIRKDQFIELIFQDNGIGIPEDIDFEKTESLGLYLIKILTQQIDGTVMVTREHGTAYKIVFPRV